MDITEKLGFNKFTEIDFFDVENINSNFQKLDDMNLCKESGKITSSAYGGNVSVVTWYYRKYADNTVDMYAVVDFSILQCIIGTNAPFVSETIGLLYPFTLTSVTNVQASISSTDLNFIHQIHDADTVLKGLQLRVEALHSELSNTDPKTIYVSVRGVL